MSKRDLLLSLLTSHPQTAIPAAFFLHFDPIYHRGQAAIDKHLEYFRATDMDFVKIQYELKFPTLTNILRPEDWGKMPLYTEDFFLPQLQVVEGLVKAAGKDALIIMTLYSPFMCAGHAVGPERVVNHILENPEAVKQGMEIITASLMNFVQGCIERGLDGFYHSTQGGETERFSTPQPFLECVKPYDLILMEEINRRLPFNILHVCDYHGGYTDLSPFLDYPGHIVNASLKLGERILTTKEIAQLFNRPFMGGLDRHGILVNGSPDEIRQAVQDVLTQAPERFILAADCTVPSEINWSNLRLAIDTAHRYKP
jgi:uroporphyrinogen decarboxylase